MSQIYNSPHVFENVALNVMAEAFDQAQTFAGDLASPKSMADAIVAAARAGETDLSRLVKIGIEAGTAKITPA